MTTISTTTPITMGTRIFVSIDLYPHTIWDASTGSSDVEVRKKSNLLIVDLLRFVGRDAVNLHLSNRTYDSYKFKSGRLGILHVSGTDSLRERPAGSGSNFGDEACATDEAGTAHSNCGEKGRTG